jgi:hypothetical protein
VAHTCPLVIDSYCRVGQLPYRAFHRVLSVSIQRNIAPVACTFDYIYNMSFAVASHVCRRAVRVTPRLAPSPRLPSTRGMAMAVARKYEEEAPIDDKKAKVDRVWMEPINLRPQEVQRREALSRFACIPHVLKGVLLAGCRFPVCTYHRTG